MPTSSPISLRHPLSSGSTTGPSGDPSLSLDEQIRASRRELIGLLAAGTAHGLNNILSAICSNSALAQLAYRTDPKSGEELLQQIENSAMAASNLTRGMAMWI
jgi:hypothetical protein